MGKKKDKSNLNTNEYPKWTCDKCAIEAGGHINADSVITYHPDICDVCNYWKSVTEPSDFGYPKLEKKFCKKIILKELQDQFMELKMNGQDEYAKYIKERYDEIDKKK